MMKILLLINCDEEHSYDEVKAHLSEYEEKTKKVNGITYSYYEYKNNLGDNAHYYLYEYNNKTYSINFFLGENPGNIEDVFMNNVRLNNIKSSNLLTRFFGC